MGHMRVLTLGSGESACGAQPTRAQHITAEVPPPKEGASPPSPPAPEGLGTQKERGSLSLSCIFSHLAQVHVLGREVGGKSSIALTQSPASSW